jgi:hypothetical protein
MRARFLLVLACLALAAMVLPFGGCGDNDNSTLPCCPVCGDGMCSGDEHSCSCPQDCGSTVCLQIIPTCGDGVCETEGSPAESHENCPADCPLRCRTCEAQERSRAAGSVASSSSRITGK